MAFPQTPLDVEVSLAIGADLSADPDTWDWTDVTPSVREAPRVKISRGRRTRIGIVSPLTGEAVVDNTDGALARHNPMSPHFGQLKRNTPIRVRVDNGGGPITRLAAFVPGFPPSWDPSEQDQVVTLKAVGLLDRLSRSRSLGSPLFRTMSGISELGYTPLALWPMEDGSRATEYAGIRGVVPIVPYGSHTSASLSTLTGSSPLPSFSEGTRLNGVVPGYDDTGKWMVQFAAFVPSAPAAEYTIARILTPAGTVNRWDINIEFGTSDELVMRGYTGINTQVTSSTVSFDSGALHGDDDFYGHWFMISLACYQNGGNISSYLMARREEQYDLAPGSDSVAGTLGKVIEPRLIAPVDGTGFGHLGVYVDSLMDFSDPYTLSAYNSSALNGHAGEMAHIRLARLCRQANVRFECDATTSAYMGPQLINTLLANLNDCQQADLGLLCDSLEWGIRYVALSERYNIASPAIQLDYSAGEIAPPWNPDDDARQYVNSARVTRPSGSSHVSADEDDVDEVGEYELPASPNLETDGQLPTYGDWLVHLGTTDELTWPAVKPNILAVPALLDDWMAADLADQMWIVGHPEPLAPDTIRQVIEGYTEVLGSYTYDVTAVLSPASPYDVAVVEDDVLGKADTAGMELAVAVSSSATSLTVHTTEPPKATTDSGEYPVDLYIGGEVITATACADVSRAFVAVGTVAHGSNASVVPGMPAGLAAGDLLLLFSAINSSVGEPVAPDGYTLGAEMFNARVFYKYATASEVAPTQTFLNGLAGETTTAQLCAFRGIGRTLHAAEVTVSTMQNIPYPELGVSREDCLILYCGWKGDDWTSVASPGTEIAEPDTTTGNDQGIVWAYTLATTPATVASGTFTVTGGASATTRGAVLAFGSDMQTLTVTRSTNTVSKAQAVGERIRLASGAVPAL